VTLGLRERRGITEATMAIFTGRIERAIALALRAHEAQVRKGDGQLPYVVHPVTVALILSRYTGDEDTIIAGLLHDTLEDTLVTADEIEQAFGGKVRDMVLDVTEPDLPGLSWETRKARYLRRLQTAPRPSLLVAGADKTANLISMIAAHTAAGDALWERFHAPPGAKLAFYRQVHALIRGAWPSCPLLQEFGNRLEEAERKVGARL
jgi:(p)ppGpp synthase/HD superfamily hydrolase